MKYGFHLNITIFVQCTNENVDAFFQILKNKFACFSCDEVKIIGQYWKIPDYYEFHFSKSDSSIEEIKSCMKALPTDSSDLTDLCDDYSWVWDKGENILFFEELMWVHIHAFKPSLK